TDSSCNESSAGFRWRTLRPITRSKTPARWSRLSTRYSQSSDVGRDWTGAVPIFLQGVTALVRSETVNGKGATFRLWDARSTHPVPDHTTVFMRSIQVDITSSIESAHQRCENNSTST